MDRGFKVSVIIPVYNAEKYLRRSVESAVNIPEVGEIILVEDASPDNALDICKQLATQYPKVKVFQHPGRENRGAGASRNLGIRNASFEFLAFLDADDLYLPNRFLRVKEMFADDASIDGVYAPVGTAFESDRENFFGTNQNKLDGDKHITGFKEMIKPENLFSELLTMSKGTFHTDGIVLKKSLLEKTGLFNEDLRLHQDSELWLRCAYFGKLVGVPDKEAVAIRWVHKENRIRAVNFKSRSKYYSTVYKQYKERQLSTNDRRVLERKYLRYFPKRLTYGMPQLIQKAELALLFVLLKLSIIGR